MDSVWLWRVGRQFGCICCEVTFGLDTTEGMVPGHRANIHDPLDINWEEDVCRAAFTLRIKTSCLGLWFFFFGTQE